MASAATLIRSGRTAIAKGSTIHLVAAFPHQGTLKINIPLPPEKVEELAAELRAGLELDGGCHYSELMSVWLTLLRRALGR